MAGPNSLTSYGKEASRVENAATQSKTKKNHPYKFGIIDKIKKDDGVLAKPFVKVRYEDTPDQVTPNWIVLEDHPLLIALCYSSRLENLVGFRVKVEVYNYSSDAGLARIVGDKILDIAQYDPQLPSNGIKLI